MQCSRTTTTHGSTQVKYLKIVFKYSTWVNVLSHSTTVFYCILCQRKDLQIRDLTFKVLVFWSAALLVLLRQHHNFQSFCVHLNPTCMCLTKSCLGTVYTVFKHKHRCLSTHKQPNLIYISMVFSAPCDILITTLLIHKVTMKRPLIT